ncbi:yjaB [Escherichia coli O104:H4 str. C227-11]|nr:yjaB [Escherichia coli O104:H4 str. C227-11]
MWVAVNERDQPVGFMLLSGQHMDALFIDPDVRGCGVGRMLVEHALSMAPELTTNVNEQNEQAVGFYKKVGFKVTGRSEVDDLGKPYPLLNLAYVGNKPPCRACPGWRRRASVASDLFLHQRKKAQSSDWAFCLI